MSGAALGVAAIVANVLVPGAGLIVQHLPQIAAFLSGINGKCDQLSLNEAHFKRVSSRLHELLTQLTTMEANGQLPSIQVVKRYTELLDAFDAFLTKYLASNFICRLLTQDTVLNKITVFHQEVDELLTVLNLAHIAHMTDWRAQYELDQADENTKWTALLQSNRLLVDECVDARKQREAMLRLLHALHRPTVSGQQRQLVKTAFQALQRISNSAVVEVPPWFIPPEDVSISNVAFARGATAAIHHGVWRLHTPVVVKCFNSTSPHLDHEIELWVKLRHPYVLAMYGACHIGNTPFVLCEVAHTSLDAYSCQLESPVERSHEIPRMLWEAALGVQHLHQNNIVHGDLKCNNLLVTNDGHIKLADFGSSFHLLMGARPTETQEFSLRWTAPECLDGAISRTLFTDIFALGLCFVEALTTEVPFSEFTADADVREAIRSGRLPDLHDWPGFIPLVAAMCHSDPTQRPAIDSIVVKLHDMLAAMPHTAACSHCASTLLPQATFCHSCGVAVKASAISTAEGSSSMQPRQIPDSDHIVREYGYALKDEAKSENPIEKDRARRRRHSIHLSISDIHNMVANQEVESLVDLLTQAAAPMQEKALQALLNMAAEAPRLVASGVLDPLVDLAAKGSTPTCKELAAALLGLLAYRRPENAKLIREKGGIQALIKLLRQGTFVQRSFALRGIAYITDVDADSCMLVVDESGISAVCEMLRGSDRLKEHALWVLANISDEAIQSGLVDTSLLLQIVTEIEDMSYDQQAHALRLLTNTVESLPRKLIVSLIPLLVTLMRRHQHEGVLARAMAKVSFINDEYSSLLVHCGAIPLLWALFQQNKSSEACLVALTNLAIDDDCRCQLSRNRGLVLALTCLKHENPPCIQTAAAHLCHNLSLEEANREWIVELGGVRSLLQLILERNELVQLGLVTLSRLTLISSSLDPFVPVVAWSVHQLLPRRRDDDFMVVVLSMLQNAILNEQCMEAFLSAGGIAILLKLLVKSSHTHLVIAILANVSNSYDSVTAIVRDPEAMYTIMNSASSSTWLEKRQALQCVSNITYIEPASMQVVKGRGIPLLVEIICTPRDESDPRFELQSYALAIIYHLTHHEPFQTLLMNDTSLIPKLRRWASSSTSGATIAHATLMRLGLSTTRKGTMRSLYKTTIAKLKHAVSSLSNQDDEEASPLVIQLQQKRSRLNALHALAGRIPHETSPQDIVASGALDIILTFLDDKTLRSPALRVIYLIVDHSEQLSQNSIDRMLPPLLRVTKSDRGSERTLATEIVLSLANHGHAKADIVCDLTPEDDSAVLLH
ncbi:Leucine-rich repeat serine/threonine-protein kinase 2 [Aphanomyces cochlioides]|nr:Leucine-rich repeat serine/threonine-protein kinase 2 [Aphanomyces cochlioides]